MDEEYNESLKDELHTCKGLYLSGGNNFSFLKRLKEYQLVECIRTMVEEGKPIIGVSAGATILADTIKMAEYRT